MAKLNFQQPLLQPLVSHDLSEMCWFAAQETISYYMNDENSYAA